MAIEIPEDAYTLTPCGPLGGKTGLAQGGEFLGEFTETEDALAFAAERMEREKFWPSLVWVSDHGNWWYIDKDGNEIKVETEECEFCGEEFEEGELEFHTPHCPENDEEE